MPDKKQMTTSLVILLATILLVAGAIVVNQKNEEQKSNQSTTSRSDSNEESTTVSSSTTYKEGTYNATGSYQSPGGKEAIKISITINSDGTITKTDAESQAVSGDGEQFQKQFISGYKSKVVSKKINGIELNQVSGSSLTPEGFNDALQQIEQQARV